MNYSAMIQNRKSVRSFSDRKVPFSALTEIKNYYQTSVRRLIPELETELYFFGDDAKVALEGAAGYNSFLVGAPQYLVLLSQRHELAELNAGYMMEDLILNLTDMDLNTCWVTFTDSELVKEALGIDSELDVAAIAAFGYGVKTTKRLRLNIKSMSNIDISAKRHYFEPKRGVNDMVFMDTWGSNYKLNDYIGFFDDMLWEAFYAASLSPSYLNRQAYGFVIHDGRITLVRRPDEYTTELDGKLSLGIVLLHFSSVAENWAGPVRWSFGCMRFPMAGDEVDYEETKKMIDAFLDAGFNYFDTAHGYLNGKSEIALRECLTSRYPRDAYVLTNKLSTHHFKTNADIRPLFESQLQICGVDYFDFYLMHAQDQENFAKYKACRAYETALELLAEGKIRHLGISFHDTADVLDQILTAYPQVEVVQIQLNYVDFDDPAVQSRKCLEVCRKHGKPAIIMEPVKGCNLVKLPEEAQKVFDELHGGSTASYAIRFAASQEGVMMVLSGMGSMEMVNDNCGFMADFQPLNEQEQAAVEKVCAIFRNLGAIPCTACRYCTEVCPQGISIPDLFACLNTKKIFHDWNADYYYGVHTDGRSKASDCLKCGLCENLCPQHLHIRELLEDVAKEFEKKE